MKLDMRAFLRDDLRLRVDFSASDQNRGLAPPRVQKPARETQTVLPLPRDPAQTFTGRMDLVQALGERHSQRKWRDEPLRLEEIGFLLGCAGRTQDRRAGTGFPDSTLGRMPAFV